MSAALSASAFRKFSERLTASACMTGTRIRRLSNPTEPVVPRTGCEHIATGDSSGNVIRGGAAQHGEQRLVVDDDQVDGLLDSKIGINGRNCDESLFVAALALPVRHHLAGVICEHGLDRTDRLWGQLPRSGSASTTAFDNPFETLIRPLPRRHCRSVPTSSFMWPQRRRPSRLRNSDGIRTDGTEKGRRTEVNNGHSRSTTAARKPIVTWGATL